MVVESKADMKKRVGHSPDDADAFNLWCLRDGAAVPGVVAEVNPPARSRLVDKQPVGGRWGRTERRGYRSR